MTSLYIILALLLVVLLALVVVAKVIASRKGTTTKNSGNQNRTPPNLRDSPYDESWARPLYKCCGCISFAGGCRKYNYPTDRDDVCDGYEERELFKGLARTPGYKFVPFCGHFDEPPIKMPDD